METPNTGSESSHPIHPVVGDEVLVIVDGVKKEVREGTYVVAEFKALVGVDPARELDEVVHDQLKPLDDNSKITIKGHEKFVSHVRTGGSS